MIAKHRGKVVLVDFWATWCLPCVEQLPHTLELGQRLADRGLAVVTVSCDEPTESDRVAKFLSTKQASGATNLISQFGGSPRTMDEFEIASGAVPFYKLYDRAGRLRQIVWNRSRGEKAVYAGRYRGCRRAIVGRARLTSVQSFLMQFGRFCCVIWLVPSAWR